MSIRALPAAPWAEFPAPPRNRATRTTRVCERGFAEIATEIRRAPEFYFAEDYHQQYLAKNHRRLVPVGVAPAK